MNTVTRLFILTMLTACTGIGFSINEAKGKRQVQVDDCMYWQSKVDASIILPTNFKEINEKELHTRMEAIECLLKLEGNKGQAKFSGAVKDNVSQIFEHATVEVAALYYISYLYYQKFDHANAVALRDERTGKVNSPEIVKEAYEYYRDWFKEIKKVGLTKAKEMEMDPLKGKPIKWY